MLQKTGDKAESLKAAASREFREEVGLQLNSSLSPLCSYQAGLVSLGRSYYITFFLGSVSEGGDRSSLKALLSGVCSKEVGAVALIPCKLAHLFKPQSIGGLSVQGNRKLAEEQGYKARGIIVDESNDELREMEFELGKEIVGNGGEGDKGGGLGMVSWTAIELADFRGCNDYLKISRSFLSSSITGQANWNHRRPEGCQDTYEPTTTNALDLSTTQSHTTSPSISPN